MSKLAALVAVIVLAAVAVAVAVAVAAAEKHAARHVIERGVAPSGDRYRFTASMPERGELCTGLMTWGKGGSGGSSSCGTPQPRQRLSGAWDLSCENGDLFVHAWATRAAAAIRVRPVAGRAVHGRVAPLPWRFRQARRSLVLVASDRALPGTLRVVDGAGATIRNLRLPSRRELCRKVGSLKPSGVFGTLDAAP